MADTTSTARIAVQVEGIEQINELGAAFAKLAEGASRPQRTAAGRRSTAGAERQAQSLGERVGKQAGEVLGSTLRSPFEAVKVGAGQASSAILSFAGPIARLGASAVTAAGPAGFAAVAVAVVAVGVPLFNLAATLRILRMSFRWAQDAADAQLRSIARTKRTFPGAIGDAFAAAQQRTGEKLRVATALFGDGAEGLAEQITRRFTDVRLGRGIRGDQDIFRRWGITPQAVQMVEQARGGERMDITDWLTYFIGRREQLDAQQAASREGSTQWRRIVGARAMLFDDSLKLFNQRFSDIVGTWSRDDLKKLRDNLRAAAPLGAVPDAPYRARMFVVELKTTQGIFAQLKRGIAGDVQPILTTMMDGLREWLTSTDMNGRSMGMQLRKLATALAVHAWETMESLLRDINPSDVRNFVQLLNNWDPSSVIRIIEGATPLLLEVGTFIRGMAKVAKVMFHPWSAIPKTPADWLRLFGKGTPEEAAAAAGIAPGGAFGRAIGRALGYGPGATAAGGGGYLGGGGPGAGAAGGGPMEAPGPPGAPLTFPEGVSPQTGAGLVREMTVRMARAGTRPSAPSGSTVSTSPSGRKFSVGREFAANFQGFINDYERAGGLIGPESGGLSARPGNASYHPLGYAIDINQIGYGIRGKGGRTLPEETEDRLAAEWGIFPGSQFRGRSDRGHFEVRNRQAAQQALARKTQVATGGGGVAANDNAGGGMPLGGGPAAPAPTTGGSGWLRQQRAGLAGQWSGQYERIASLVMAEVGSQGEQAVQAKLETLFNRAQTRGQQDLNKLFGAYYGRNPRGRTQSATFREQFKRAWANVTGGSDITNLATGNWSGRWGGGLGGAGGYMTAAFGPAGQKEQFSVQAADAPKIRQWRRLKAEYDAANPPTQAEAQAEAQAVAQGLSAAPPPAPTQAAGMITPGAGAPQARGSVKELQMAQASIRKLPLPRGVRSYLEYAAAHTGLEVHVMSGGQAPIGTRGPRTGSTRHDVSGAGAADIKLRDPTTGRFLDMRNPSDAARMAEFTARSVSAGATGVGAGLRYMGANTIHIGGGTRATWGGAGWISAAAERGRRMPVTAPPPIAPAEPPRTPPVVMTAEEERLKGPGGRGGLLELRRRRLLATVSRITAEAEAGRRAAAGEDEAEAEEKTDDTETLKQRQRDKDKESLTEKPRTRKPLEEGKAAGEAAAKSFKEGIKDTKIPIKKDKEDEDKERDKKSEEEKEAA